MQQEFCFNLTVAGSYTVTATDTKGCSVTSPAMTIGIESAYGNDANVSAVTCPNSQLR
jgi:hypothetical protein